MATKVKPLQDNVLVELKKEEKVTETGIVLPDSANEDKPQEGIVKAVGAGKISHGKEVKPEVKEGDKILFAKYSGTEIKIDKEDYLILKSDDILAVIE